MKIFLNNKWIDERLAKISIYDLSILRGFGVFDFLRTYNRKPFLLEEHINRFFRSLKTLQLKPAYNKNKIKEIIYQGIDLNKGSDLNIRIIQTGGVAEDGITPSQPNFAILFTKAISYPKTYYTKGIKIITTPYARIFPSAKTLNYTAGVLALLKAKRQNAVEALYVDDKYIYECITSNFFAVIKEKIYTPKDKILIGTVRNLVIKLAKKLNLPIIETKLKINQIKNFDEAFITASNKEIMPVVQINNLVIGDKQPGPITRKLLLEYKILTNQKAN
ncbi:MAG: branched chain amino acid aminotransferase [Patescibacteria group bacterium]|nr:MAG: branched chain amino acid aminotransferase [Patescibacteria group bacterium]